MGRTALVTTCEWMPRAASCGRIAFELTIPDERLAADDRDVQRIVAIDERHEALHQFVALVVGETPQRDASAAEVLVAIGVASRTAQRALARDLDRDVGAMAGENAAPGLKHFLGSNPRRAHVANIMVLKTPAARHKNGARVMLVLTNARFDHPAAHRAPSLEAPRVGRVHARGNQQEPANRQYEGELIDHKESFKRETRYLKNGEIWCFTVNRRWVRDGNVNGNIARFINHACRPNCYSQIIGRDIWVRAGRNIDAG